MKKKLLIAAVAGGAAVVCAVACNKRGGPGEFVQGKMRRCMEEMPEDLPPRIMFDNLAATRTNTDEILELLHSETTADHAIS